MEFERYLFGSDIHTKLWKQILQLCFDNSILFYILTSGSKFGIIRTFQLLELDDFVTEVLCNNPSVDINPINQSESSDREDFKKMNKYQIIERIIAQPTSRGIFVDNDERNRNNSKLCPNIDFKHARGIQIDRFVDKTYQTRFSSFVSDLSVEYKSPISEFSRMSYDKRYSNLVDENILHEIIRDITTRAKEIRFLFADFDGTMSPWRSALPFHVEGFNNRFYSHFNVVHVEN
jgi:hypothetical protein